MLTEEEILELSEGIEADLVVSRVAGWRVHKPTQSIVTAYQLEETVFENNKTAPYAAHLKNIVRNESEPGFSTDWLIAHATPLQRTKAFLLTMA